MSILEIILVGAAWIFFAVYIAAAMNGGDK